MERLSTTLLVMMFAFSSFALGEEKADCMGYWTKVRELNDRYESDHDPKAATALWRLLPTRKKLAPGGCTKREETITALSRDSAYRTQRVRNEDIVAIQLSFRLMNIADGAFAEELDIDLGKLITKSPCIFLKYLQAEHGDGYCSDGLVGNTGEYDRDPAKDRAEMKKRALALESVKDRALGKLRDLCVSRLKQLQNSG